MFKRVLLAAACCAALTGPLAACSPKAEEPAAPAADAAASTAPGKPVPPAYEKSTAEPSQPSLPKLAYSHHYAIEAPSRSVSLLVDKHEAACVAAGPAICQVTGSNVHQVSRNNTVGQLSLRAEGGWLSGFRKGLAADAESVGGKVASSGTDTENLSRSLIDTDAVLRARLTLRDRLQSLADHHKGTIEELMSVESQLADVQAEIDGARGNLADMRGRVAMSAITIDYGPKAGVVGVWAAVAATVILLAALLVLAFRRKPLPALAAKA